MQKMTKAQIAKLAKLQSEQAAAMTQVFMAAAPRNDVRFSDCLKMASPAVAARHREASEALREYETQMAIEGRAHRSPSYGDLYPNTGA